MKSVFTKRQIAALKKLINHADPAVREQAQRIARMTAALQEAAQ